MTVVLLKPEEEPEIEVRRRAAQNFLERQSAQTAEWGDGLDNLAEEISRIALAYRDGTVGDDLRQLAHRCGQTASGLGFIRMARIARTVAVLADARDAGDCAALAANVARLMRLGDRSLVTLWMADDLIS